MTPVYLALTFLRRLLCLLSHRLAVALGEWLGRVWYAVDVRHRRVAKANLVNAFPEWSHRQVCRTARRVFRHFARVLIDFLRLPRYADPAYHARWLSVVGEEHLRKAHALGRGVILLSAHWGNWELMGLTCAALGYRVSAIARKIGSRGLTRFINETRGVTGMRVLDKMQAARPTLAALGAGEYVGILIDQNDAVTGIPASFFGRECATTPALASFALKTGAPVVPAVCPLGPDGRYRARFFEPITPPQTGDPQRDAAVMTQRLTSFVEQRVREIPEQWFWVHRRWKPFDCGCMRRGFRYVETVLIKMPNWLGDTVMSLPVCEYLRTAYPHARIIALIRAPYGGVLEGNAYVDEVIEYSHRRGVRGLLDLARTLRRLRRRYFHAAVLMTNSFSSALWIALAGIPLRVGTRGQWRRWLLTHTVRPRPRDIHQRDHYVEIAARLADAPRPSPRQVTVTDEHAAWAEQFLRAHGVNSDTPIVGLNPSAGTGPAKRWLPERFAEVGRRLHDAYGATLLVFGAAHDAALTESVVRQIGRGAHDLAGRTTVAQLAALMARCRLFITNDTGPMHLADAVGTTVVAIFGSTNPVCTSPAGPATVIKKECDCAPCMRRECNRDFRCMTSITADEVFEQAAAYLREER